MRALALFAASIFVSCLSAQPPAPSSFPARPGAVWTPECCGRPIEREEPKYPEEAARAGRSGWVAVSGILDDRGWVTEPKVLASEPAGVFDAAALAAFDAWRYKVPAATSAPGSASAGPREVREVIRFERRRPPASMPSESGGSGSGGGMPGY